MATLYPFRADAVIHILMVQQNHKLSPRGVACCLLKPLMLGSWLLWEPASNRLIQSASVIFLRFQLSGITGAGPEKGSLSHVVTVAILGQVPTECYFKDENMAIDTLPVTKDITIPEHLGQVLSGPLSQEWRKACKAEFKQMALRDVWEPVDKDNVMKTIGHQWVFNVKSHADGTVEKFKARLAAWGDCQRPGVDCTYCIADVAPACPGPCHMQQLGPVVF
ncbi:hypothetical protein O181_049715 [Austropuccinia psidii MF-1]|uniref:Reverse transcriptase Ty1/copia-type domain-containing protein n=1 Tax=Austropuccinia psidii MF-1 TaxID=1389203 RepID=A0A9Q3DU25_9BASI|nr:hypothetical protein [Austropuccinia psidii MF-1]